MYYLRATGFSVAIQQMMPHKQKRDQAKSTRPSTVLSSGKKLVTDLGNGCSLL